MRKSMALLVVAASLAAAGAAWAADTNTLTVQANVVGTCKFVSATSTLNFGALDPSSGADVNGSTTTQFWCTKGVTTDSITAGQGLNFSGGKNQMKDSVSGEVIPYTLTLTKDGLSNSGPAAPRTLTIAGNVLGSDYTGKSAGNYSDTVTISINP
jgi:spore coat protein U-like protein